MTKVIIKKIFVYFLVIVLYFIFIHQLSWYTMKHVVKEKLPESTEKQIVIPSTTVTLSQKIFLEGTYIFIII